MLRLAATSIAILFAISGTAAAQSILHDRGAFIAVSGDLAPGFTGGEVFGGAPIFSDVAIDAEGRISFRGTVSGGQVSSFDNVALYRGHHSTDLARLLRSGDPEPTGTIPGAVLSSSLFGSGLASSRMTSSGVLTFNGWLMGGGVTANSDAAIFTGTPGAFQSIVREGDPAPGTSGATFFTNFSFADAGHVNVNDAGQFSFGSQIIGGDVVLPINDYAIFTGTVGNTVMAARKGDAGPNGATIFILAQSLSPTLNGPGQIVFDLTYDLGSGAPAVTTANDRSIWIWSPVSGSAPLVREGDPAPIPGVTFSQPADDNWIPKSASNCFTNSGRLLVRTSLGGAVSAGVDDGALAILSLSGHVIAARLGEAAPVGGTTIAGFAANSGGMQLNESGRVAFGATLAGPSVNMTNDSALLTGFPGALIAIAREGDPAPGTGGGVFDTLATPGAVMNDSGQIVFGCILIGGAHPGASFWSWDPTRGLEALSLSGESIEVRPGVTKTVFSAGISPAGNGDGDALGFSDDGTIAMKVNFTDTTAAIAKVRIGSLSGSPSVIAAPLGGSHALHLDAGAAHGGETYVLIGSVSGDAPGTMVAGVTIPLNFDAYTNYMVTSANVGPFVSTFGALDSNGRATARIIVPPNVPGLAGTVAHHAFVTLDTSFLITFVSEASRLDIVP